MDGTLVASKYDWPAIRRELGVDGGAIVDELNALDEPERSEKWQRLACLEREASAEAKLHDGVEDMLDLLKDHVVPTALVTNNSADNVALLLGRFGLSFDVVLSRDCGLWKPSGAPLVEAALRLGVDIHRTLAVGDSRYDLLAAKDAGCAAVFILYDDQGVFADEADISLPDVPALTDYLLDIL